MPIHDDTADSKPPVPAEDDLTLFRREMKDVARLDTDRVPPLRRRLRPVPLKTIENEQQVLVDMLSDQTWGEHELETGEELLYLKPGVQTRLLQRLRRGHFAVAAVLDLHGLSVTEARDALSVFLRECLLRDYRCVRIIHGKGRGSRHGRAIIKGKLDRWLRLREEVVAYCSARRVDGGTGAVYVLLRRAG